MSRYLAMTLTIGGSKTFEEPIPNGLSFGCHALEDGF